MKELTFDNGLKLIVEERNTKTVSIAVAVKAGSFLDYKGYSGLAHFIEHLILRGGKDFNKFAEKLQSCGGSIYSPYTEHAYSLYSVTILSKYADVAIGTLFELITNPRFSQNITQKEKQIVLEELNAHINDPFLYAYYKFKSNLDNSLSPIEGAEKSLKNITQEQAKSFYKQYYTPENMAISLVGNIDSNKINKTVKKTFGTLKKSNTKSPTIRLNSDIKEKLIEIKGKSQKQAHILIGGIAPTINNPDRYAMDIITASLGKTLNSRLFTKLVSEMAIARYVGVDYDMISGFFVVYATVSSDNLLRAKKSVLKTVEYFVKKGMTQKEMEITKNFLKGQDALKNEYNQNFAEKCAIEALFDNVSNIPSYETNIDSTELETINLTLKQYLDPKKLLMLVSKPGEMHGK